MAAFLGEEYSKVLEDKTARLLRCFFELHEGIGAFLTPLMDAAANNLLNARADLKARDKNGMTPLMHAAKQNKNPGRNFVLEEVKYA